MPAAMRSLPDRNGNGAGSFLPWAPASWERALKKIIAIALIAAFAASGSASAACTPASPDAVTSKAPKDAATNPQAADAKGIAEDGQHTPLETDPNAPGVTTTEGGTTTNTAKAEQEIAAAGAKTDRMKTADATAGEATAAAGTACPQ